MNTLWIKRAASLYFGITAVNVLMFIALVLVKPHLHGRLFEEDQFIENLTAVLCLVAFIVCTTAIFRAIRQRRFAIFMATLSLLAFLDEISFGIRFFSIKPLQTSTGLAVDGVHDILDLSRSWGSRWLANFQDNPSYSAAILGLKVGIVLLVLASIGWVVKKGWRFWLNAAVTYPPQAFLMVAIAMVAGSQAIDIDVMGLHKYSVMIAMEELLEMNAAIGLIFSGAVMLRPRPQASVSSEESQLTLMPQPIQREIPTHPRRNSSRR